LEPILRISGILAGSAVVLAAITAAGSLVAPRTALPRAVRFTTGAVLVSALVFALLTAGVGSVPAWLALASILIAAAFRIQAAITPPPPRLPRFHLAILAAFTVLYSIYALAPEIQPDAIGYHLRLVSDYARLHAFTNRLTFYDVLPQGLEMLFVPAFAIGGAEAAKLVHLAFLLSAIPLLRAIATELRLPATAGATAATIFFLAPVCGVAGTAAYTDAGLVAATCATLYLLFRWDRERHNSLLLCAALNAAFCYSIKPTFGWIAVAALGFVIVRARRAGPALVFTAITAAVILPWLARAYWLTGNPVAPFLNAWFPNPVSSPELEQHLVASYSAFRPGFSARTALFDYTIAGGNQGLLGAAFLLLPVALLALRTTSGKVLLTAAALLAIPIAANTGTRFLLPALAPASLALASVLPGPLGLGLVALQALSAAPPVMDLYDSRHEWRLRTLPLKAALGLTPQQTWLTQTIPDFAITTVIAKNTSPGAKILACLTVPDFYMPRESLTYWHSVEAARLTDALHFAWMSRGNRARLLSWRWTEGDYRALRLTAHSDLRIVEASFPNAEAPPQSWKMYRPGESVSLRTTGDARGADLLIWPGDQASQNTEALSATGHWEGIEAKAERHARSIDLRRDATAYIRRIGYHYILIPVSNDAFAQIGADMLQHPVDWGVESVGAAGAIRVFRILPDLM
jgi:hypothetical protein